jgi:hypothetical protein
MYLNGVGARPWPARSSRAVLPIPARDPARRLRRQYPLAIGLLHASFNASGHERGWQYVPAMIMLTLAVMVYRPLPSRSVTRGFARAWSQTQRPCAPQASLSGR